MHHARRPRQRRVVIWLASIGLALLGSLAVHSAAAAMPPQAPDAPFTTVDGQTLSTARFKGQPTMIWLLSTWCGSCAAGLDTLARHAAELEKTDLQVVVLRNYENGGYPGVDLQHFFNEVVPDFKLPANWTLGQASRELNNVYNPQHYPDIYFLIDGPGRVQEADGAPSATMDKILEFARTGR